MGVEVDHPDLPPGRPAVTPSSIGHVIEWSPPSATTTVPAATSASTVSRRRENVPGMSVSTTSRSPTSAAPAAAIDSPVLVANVV